jgi:hypothetical protein
VFFFGIRPSFGTITQLALALLPLAGGAQWHRNFTVDGDSGERVVHAGSSNPVRPPSRDAPPQSSPSP